MAKKKSVTRTVYKRQQGLPDEEVAYRLVKLYFDDVANRSLKRRARLDAVINAYFYALQRIGNKEKELKEIKRIVEEEKDTEADAKEQLLLGSAGEEKEESSAEEEGESKGSVA